MTADPPALLTPTDLPFCTALLLEPTEAPPGRFFAAFQPREGFVRLIGQGVLEEFGSLSSPIFLAPAALLGKIYDAGIALAAGRDPELPLDAGWPPLCVGLARPAPQLPPDWERRLLGALRGAAPGGPGPRPETSPSVPPGADAEAGAEVTAVGDGEAAVPRSARILHHTITAVRRGEAAVLVTDAPLLPRQLRRLCEASDAAITIAVATGNRLGRRTDGSPAPLRMATEARLGLLTAAARGLLAAGASGLS